MYYYKSFFCVLRALRKGGFRDKDDFLVVSSRDKTSQPQMYVPLLLVFITILSVYRMFSNEITCLVGLHQLTILSLCLLISLFEIIRNVPQNLTFIFHLQKQCKVMKIGRQV